MKSNETPGDSSRPLRLDHNAASADPSLPAFLARPDDAPVYHGFPVLNRDFDGWRFGTISDYSVEDPADWGDAFVIAPDGTRAGLAWALDTPSFYQILPPDEQRWGVYGVRLERKVSSDNELAEGLAKFLPLLREKWRAAKR